MKNLLQIIVLAVLCSAFLTCPARPQHTNIFSNSHLAEKIYLQLDGKVYTTDKTIWFKAIVVNADDHAPTKLSGVLYVELIGPNEKVIEKKLIKLENGIGNGFFDLNKNYSEGLYLIRAYTEWDKNFNTDFIFKEYIQVFDPSAKVKPDPIGNITLVEKQNNERQLTAYLDPLSIDSLHKKELTLFLTLDNKKDTLFIKRNDNDKYVIDYTIPDSCQFVTLQMQTKNLSSYTKTVVLDKDRLDMQFFPESGELVDGLESKVGFKALDYNGKGKYVEGEIVDGKDKVISLFKSNQLGMGSFFLTRADKNTTYFARLKAQSDKNIENLYPLPKVASQGNVLSVIRNGDEIQVAASSTYLKNDTAYVRVSCRGLVYFDIKGSLKEGSLAFKIPAKELPDGIIAFTLMDSPMHPVAERLYFNEKPESRLKIEISTDRDTYSLRELTRLNIKTTNNNGEPVNANLSLLVLNKEEMGEIQNMRQNILSYLLFSSDLKGEIENPGYYFKRDISNYDDLDALLLTQGWRKYLYDKPVDAFSFRPESRLNVSGTVGGVLFQKRSKEVELTLMTFGHRKSVQTLTTDSLGRFHFDINDEYGQNLNILIQSANHAGRRKDYTIALDKKQPPVISFNHIISIGKVDSIVHKLVEKNIERKKMEETYRLSSGDIQLPEVVVEAYKMTPNRKRVMEEYGKPDRVISGETIQEKEEKWSFGLYSVLMSKFPDILIHRFLGYPGYLPGFLMAQVRASRETLVVIDGIPVKLYDYPLIPNIPPSEVSSFEIIKDAKNFVNLYLDFNPEVSPLDAPATGDVIAIYTYGGKGIYGAFKSTGILLTAVPVFSALREFYSPKYENLKPSDWYKPDIRALIEWEPNLRAARQGMVSTTFYNADIAGEMQVVVEAISDNGEIGYQEILYKVKKRD